MRALLGLLVAGAILTGCATHRRATSAGEAQQCEDNMRLIVATNTSSRFQDLMYGSANLGTVSPGQTVRQLVAGQQRAYEVAREERLAISVSRRANTFKREQTARLRRVTAALRDRISRPRMRSSAIRKRLIAEGETAEVAIRWCDAWERAAESQGVPEDDNYWNRATQWIWTERAAGRTP